MCNTHVLEAKATIADRADLATNKGFDAFHFIEGGDA